MVLRVEADLPEEEDYSESTNRYTDLDHCHRSCVLGCKEFDCSIQNSRTNCYSDYRCSSSSLPSNGC